MTAVQTSCVRVEQVSVCYNMCFRDIGVNINDCNAKHSCVKILLKKSSLVLTIY